MDTAEIALNAPLKYTPEEKKHFIDPAMQEAQSANFPSALEIVTNGLDAHPASERLLFLKAYFGYKVADSMSNELASYPKAIQTLGNEALMIDGATTSQLLSKFKQIVGTLTEAEDAINELLQVSPQNREVVDFKSYIDLKRQQLNQESENMLATISKSPQMAGGFCVGCQRSISYDTQKVVFKRTSDSRLEAWHFGCYQSARKN